LEFKFPAQRGMAFLILTLFGSMAAKIQVFLG